MAGRNCGKQTASVNSRPVFVIGALISASDAFVYAIQTTHWGADMIIAGAKTFVAEAEATIFGTAFNIPAPPLQDWPPTSDER